MVLVQAGMALPATTKLLADQLCVFVVVVTILKVRFHGFIEFKQLLNHKNTYSLRKRQPDLQELPIEIQ